MKCSMFYSPDLVKSVQIRIYFWSVFSCIPTEYRKIRIRNNSVFGHFSRNDGVGRRMNLMRFKGACSSRVWENNLTKTCTFTSGSSATYTRFKGSLLTSEIKASLLKFFSFFFFLWSLIWSHKRTSATVTLSRFVMTWSIDFKSFCLV